MTDLRGCSAAVLLAFSEWTVEMQYGELVDGYTSRSSVRVRYVNIDRSRLEAPTCLTEYSPPTVPPFSIAILVATTILISLRADRERIITPPSG